MASRGPVSVARDGRRHGEHVVIAKAVSQVSRQERPWLVKVTWAAQPPAARPSARRGGEAATDVIAEESVVLEDDEQSVGGTRQSRICPWLARPAALFRNVV
jgi:hypothetical protein